MNIMFFTLFLYTLHGDLWFSALLHSSQLTVFPGTSSESWKRVGEFVYFLALLTSAVSSAGRSKGFSVIGPRRQEGTWVSSLSVGSTTGGCSRVQEGETSASLRNPVGKKGEKRTMAVVGLSEKVLYLCLKCFTAVWVPGRVTGCHP